MTGEGQVKELFRFHKNVDGGIKPLPISIINETNYICTGLECKNIFSNVKFEQSREKDRCKLDLEVGVCETPAKYIYVGLTHRNIKSFISSL